MKDGFQGISRSAPGQQGHHKGCRFGRGAFHGAGRQVKELNGCGACYRPIRIQGLITLPLL